MLRAISVLSGTFPVSHVVEQVTAELAGFPQFAQSRYTFAKRYGVTVPGADDCIY
jgi:hypothetical protein